MHIDKNQEVVYNIIVKKRGGTMGQVKKVYTRDQIAQKNAKIISSYYECLDTLKIVKNYINSLNENEKKRFSDLINNVSVLDAVFRALEENIKKENEYQTQNGIVADEDLQALGKICDGIKDGFSPSSGDKISFKGQKTAEEYEFTTQVTIDGKAYAVSCASVEELRKKVSNQLSDELKKEIDKIKEYSNYLNNIRVKLVGDGLIDLGMKGAIDKFKKVWKNSPSAEQTRLLNLMDGLFKCIKGNYKNMMDSFSDQNTEFSQDLKEAISFTNGDISSYNGSMITASPKIKTNSLGTKKEVWNAQITKLDEVLQNAAVIDNLTSSKPRKFANKHGSVIKKLVIVTLIAAGLAGIIGTWAGLTDGKFRAPDPTNDQPNSGNDNGPVEIITTVKEYQDKVNDKIENLKTASAKWTQAYQEMFAPYLNGTNENYNALMAISYASTSEDDIKLAESLSDTILADLVKIETSAEIAADQETIPQETTVFEGAELSSVPNINDFKIKRFPGTATKVEVEFIQNGKRQGDAEVRIYFTDKDGSVSYIQEVGIDSALTYLGENREVDAAELNDMLNNADKTTSNVSTLRNHIDEVSGLTTADGVAVTDFYIDEDDLSKLISGDKVDVNWEIVLADGRTIEQHTSMKYLISDEDKPADIENKALQTLAVSVREMYANSINNDSEM